MRWLLLVPVWFLAGCVGGTIDPALLDELRLDACEIGEVTITGDLNVGGVPFFSSTLHLDIREVQTADTLPYPCLERGAPNEP